MITRCQQGADELGLSFRGLHAACSAIERELQAGTMPGSVLGVLYQERQWIYAAGYANPKPEQAHASPLSASEETLYDCASLTKVTVTLPLILRLIDEGMLTLSTRVSDILPSFGQQGKEEVTIGELLTHTSGLQADMNLHAHGWTREQMWDALYAAPLVTESGTEVIYSDIGFLVLGRLIETLLQMPLDEAADSMIFEPLGMNSATFRPLVRQAACAATEYDDATKGHLSGVVHDEKARALGGACGHADYSQRLPICCDTPGCGCGMVWHQVMELRRQREVHCELCRRERYVMPSGATPHRSQKPIAGSVGC